MPQAIVDPEELRRFARHLQTFNRDLEHNLASLRAHMKSLEATWQDQEHAKFVDDFETALRAMGTFVDAANDHIPVLLRKAQNIDAYLHQR